MVVRKVETFPPVTMGHCMLRLPFTRSHSEWLQALHWAPSLFRPYTPKPSRLPTSSRRMM